MGKTNANHHACLPPRERQILNLLWEGHDRPELARALGLKEKTIDAHRMSLNKRLNIHNVQQLIRKALEMGLIKLDKRRVKRT